MDDAACLCGTLLEWGCSRSWPQRGWCLAALRRGRCVRLGHGPVFMSIARRVLLHSDSCSAPITGGIEKGHRSHPPRTHRPHPSTWRARERSPPARVPLPVLPAVCRGQLVAWQGQWPRRRQRMRRLAQRRVRGTTPRQRVRLGELGRQLCLPGQSPGLLLVVVLCSLSDSTTPPSALRPPWRGAHLLPLLVSLRVLLQPAW